MSETEEGKGASNSKRLHSSHSSGMESSILRFKDVNFIVGAGDKAKNILTDVSGSVRWGRKCNMRSASVESSYLNDVSCLCLGEQVSLQLWVRLGQER